MKISIRNILYVSAGGLILCASFNVSAGETASRRLEKDAQHDYENRNRQSNSGGGGSWLGGAMVGAFFQMQKQQAIHNKRRRQEYSTLRPPSEARYSNAKTYLNGQTLILENENPIWFGANGKVSSTRNNGRAYTQKWFVKGDQFCMGNNKRNVECMKFIFHEKETSIKTSSGRMVNTFQVLDINLVN